MSLPGRRQVNRLLLAELGSTIYYRSRGSDQEPSVQMLQVAEGVWRTASGCRNFMLLNR